MSSTALHATLAMPQEPAACAATPDAAPEAARYAVLRRMASAIRHQIAGALQPVSMMASMLERRTQAPTPNIEALRRNSGEMSALARSAGGECVALMSWLAPHEGESVPLAQGVEECLHLLATELSFRGFSLVDTTQSVELPVLRQTLRTMLPAALMALTDAAARTSQVAITATVNGTAVDLCLQLQPLDTDEDAARAKAYRPLTWNDVQALAHAEHAVVEVGDRSVVVRLDLLQVPPGPDTEAGWG